MTHVSPLALGAFSCNSHVTNVTLKTINNTLVEILVSIFLLTYTLFAFNACTLIQTVIIKC